MSASRNLTSWAKILAVALLAGSSLFTLGTGCEEQAGAELYADVLPSKQLSAYKWIVICFPAETPVWCPEGPRSIALFRPGERVLTHDLSTGKLKETIIKKVDVTEGEFEMITIATPKDALRVTKGHPFYTSDGWRRADELADLASIRTAGGDPLTVRVSADRSRLAGKVYNLQTQEGTYLVGNAGLLVSGGVPSEHERVGLASAERNQ